jgi:hypothetical protein
LHLSVNNEIRRCLSPLIHLAYFDRCAKIVPV